MSFIPKLNWGSWTFGKVAVGLGVDGYGIELNVVLHGNVFIIIRFRILNLRTKFG